MTSTIAIWLSMTSTIIVHAFLPSGGHAMRALMDAHRRVARIGPSGTPEEAVRTFVQAAKEIPLTQ